jgi:hypothetical protein
MLKDTSINNDRKELFILLQIGTKEGITKAQGEIEA